MDCLHSFECPIHSIRHGDSYRCSRCGDFIIVYLGTITEQVEIKTKIEQEAIYWLANKFPMAFKKTWTGGEVKKWIREQALNDRSKI